MPHQFLEVGTEAPDFRAKNITDPTEPEIALSDYRGKRGVVLVFTKPANPTLAEKVAEVYDRYSQEVEFFAVQEKRPSPNFSNGALRGIMEDWGLTFPFFLDPEQQIFDLYGVDATNLPVAYFIGKDGTILDAAKPEGGTQHLVQDLADRIQQHLLSA